MEGLLLALFSDISRTWLKNNRFQSDYQTSAAKTCQRRLTPKSGFVTSELSLFLELDGASASSWGYAVQPRCPSKIFLPPPVRTV